MLCCPTVNDEVKADLRILPEDESMTPGVVVKVFMQIVA
jgi:hypothetical protein